jgi:hypothetical protein
LFQAITKKSPAAQTLAITYLTRRQVLFAKTLSMATQMDIIGATGDLVVQIWVFDRFHAIHY